MQSFWHVKCEILSISNRVLTLSINQYPYIYSLNNNLMGNRFHSSWWIQKNPKIFELPPPRWDDTLVGRYPAKHFCFIIQYPYHLFPHNRHLVKDETLFSSVLAIILPSKMPAVRLCSKSRPCHNSTVVYWMEIARWNTVIHLQNSGNKYNLQKQHAQEATVVPCSKKIMCPKSIETNLL